MGLLESRSILRTIRYRKFSHGCCQDPMAENNFRRIMGHLDLWMLKAALGRKELLLQQDVA